MTVYSHTRMSTFEQCPLKFKLHYIDGIRTEEDSIEAFMGKRFHETMEKAYKNRTTRQFSAEDLKKIFDNLWKKEWNEHVVVVRADRTAEDYRKIGHKAIEDYHRRYAPFTAGRLIDVERKIFVDLDDNGGHKITGGIDRLMEMEDGCFEIHDYKTSNHVPDQAELDADRQLALYEIAVRKSWPSGVKSVDLVWHYVVFDKEMRSRRTPEQLEKLKRDTVALIDRIEAATEFPPCESNLCKWCNFRKICPLFAHEEKTEELPAKEFLANDGVQLVNELAALDAKKGALKADLAAIEEEMQALEEQAIDLAARQGVARFVGSDRELTIREEIQIDYPDSKSPDRPDFEAKLKELGLWEKVSGLVAATFRSLARKTWAKEGIPGSVATYVKMTPVKKAKLSRRKDEDFVM